MFRLNHWTLTGSGLAFLMMVVMPSALAQNPYADIWISPAELATISMKGAPWKRLKRAAKKSAGTPNLNNQKQRNNVLVMAKALVYVRCSLEPSHVECRDIDLTAMYNDVVEPIGEIKAQMCDSARY